MKTICGAWCSVTGALRLAGSRSEESQGLVNISSMLLSGVEKKYMPAAPPKLSIIFQMQVQPGVGGLYLHYP